MKTGEKVWPADSPMFKSSSLVKVTREGEQKTKQINKNTKSTRERSTEAAIHSLILELTKNVAMTSLQSGKSSGPDGYPSELYKKFWHKLAPLFLDMFNDSFNSGCLPQTLAQASIYSLE